MLDVGLDGENYRDAVDLLHQLNPAAELLFVSALAAQFSLHECLVETTIAARLDLSVATVETYRKGVAAKLGISGAELVRLATLYRATAWDVTGLQED